MDGNRNEIAQPHDSLARVGIDAPSLGDDCPPYKAALFSIPEIHPVTDGDGTVTSFRRPVAQSYSCARSRTEALRVMPARSRAPRTRRRTSCK